MVVFVHNPLVLRLDVRPYTDVGLCFGLMCVLIPMLACVMACMPLRAAVSSECRALA